MPKTIKRLVIFGCLLQVLLAIGQQPNSFVPLLEIIPQFESRFNIKFNYAEDVVENVVVKNFPSTLNFEETLTFLNRNTNLDFEKIAEHLVVISSPTESYICGYLVEKESGNVLTNTDFLLEDQPVKTDDQGYFKTALFGEKALFHLAVFGYDDVLINYNTTFGNCLYIEVHSQPQILSEIVINNYLSKGIDKLNDGSYRINTNEFNILPGLVEPDVLHSVQMFPGILSVNETVSEISIRGGTNDQNLILWDGIKMYQTGHFFGLISMFNPLMTQKVNLIKNGSDPELWDGTSGTISMETDSRVNDSLEISLGLNLINANVFLDVPIGKNSSLQIAGRKGLNQLFTTPTFSRYFDRISQNTEVERNSENTLSRDKNFDFYDGSLRYLYKISNKDILRINFIVTYNRLKFLESIAVDDDFRSLESNLSQNSIAGGVYYNRKWNERFSTDLQVYETDYFLEGTNANVLNNQSLLQKNKVSETGLQLSAAYKLSNYTGLDFGYKFSETGITNSNDVDNPPYRLAVTEVLRESALFSKFSIQSKNGGRLFKAGARLSYIPKLEKVLIEPRLSFSQRITQGLTLEILGELKHQTSSQLVNYRTDFLGIEKRRWFLADNNTVPVLKSQQVSLSLFYEQNNWLLSAESYYKYLNGLTSQSQAFQNQFELIQTHGTNNVYGLDLLIQKRFDIAEFWLSYAYMNNNYKFPQISANPFPSNYDITHAITFGSAANLGNLKLSLGLNWRTGKPITQPKINEEIVDNTVNFGEINAHRLDDYFRVDTSVLYNLNLTSESELVFGISLWNMLNRKNVLDDFYHIENDMVVTSYQNGLEFTPNVLVRCNF